VVSKVSFHQYRVYQWYFRQFFGLHLVQGKESDSNEAQPRTIPGSSDFAAMNMEDFGKIQAKSSSNHQQTRQYIDSHTISVSEDTMTPHRERMRVLEALDLNQTMQQEIMKQIAWIDDSIMLNLQNLVREIFYRIDLIAIALIVVNSMRYAP
jgi:hypothetical protein